jgi:hypothetical protein
MQKQATELQKQNPRSPDTKKKLAEMLSQAKEEEARQEQEENVKKKNCRPPSRSNSKRRERSCYPVGPPQPLNSRPPGHRQEKSWMMR